MNCRQGDLAVIVRCPPELDSLLGRIVRVIELRVSSLGYPAWTYEGERLRHPRTGEAAECVEDQLLRPIRDPGDDARDETLDWLPSPTKETA